MYVGETVLHLHTRTSEHMAITPVFGKTRKIHLFRHFGSHLSTNQPLSEDDFKIITSCNFEAELILREALMISKHKPFLNAKIGSAPVYLF